MPFEHYYADELTFSTYTVYTKVSMQETDLMFLPCPITLNHTQQQLC